MVVGVVMLCGGCPTRVSKETVADVANGSKAEKLKASTHVVRFASESGLIRLSNRADRKVAVILLLARACTNYFEGGASKLP
jgi:hypothetical protein